LFNQKIDKNSYNTAKQYSKKGVQDLSELPIETIVRYKEIPKGSWKLGKIIEKVRYRTYKIVKVKGKYIIRNRRFIKETKEDVNKNMYSPEPNSSTFVYNVDLSNSNSLNQQSENEIVKITNEQSENENVQTVNKQSELTTNVNEAKISTRGRKIIVSNKYKDYVCN
jgi:hypothetical protein